MNPTEIAATALLWTCLALVVYGYAGYPVLIRLASKWLGRTPIPPEWPDDAEWPSVALLIAAHNEEAVIDARIRDALAADYPRDRFEVVIGSDGSTDATAAIVGRYAGQGVRLLDFAENRGKAVVLNDAMAEIDAEIVVLSDANTDTDPGAIRRLVRWFRDPSVGVVCGRLVLVDPATGRNADGLYWKYETFLKKCEARLGALLGSNGAIYAIRRDRYVPIPPGTIIDDFVIPLLSRLRHGGRILYDAEAVATEETPADVRDEFRRRARIGAGGFQSLPLLWPLMSPRFGWLAFAFVSHKLLRWLGPFFLIGALLANLALLAHTPYRALLAAQLAFYGLSAAIPWLPAGLQSLKPLRLMGMFTSMNLALLVGFWRWASGKQRGTWKRTARAVATVEDTNG